MVKDGKKKCSKCNRTKGTHLFYRKAVTAKAPDGYQAWCKACDKKHNPTRHAYQHDYRMRNRYGITVSEYQYMLTEQDGRCYICGKRARKKRLHVDHDHAHVKAGGDLRSSVRGLLCSPCNRFLGQIRDDVTKADRVREYLERENPYA